MDVGNTLPPSLSNVSFYIWGTISDHGHLGLHYRANHKKNSLFVCQRRLVGGAIGGWAHCNGWNGIHGTESNVVSICLIPFHMFHSSLYTKPSL